MRNLPRKGSPPIPSSPRQHSWRQSVSPDRITSHLNPTGSKLLQLIALKQTNAIAIAHENEALKIANEKGKEIVLLIVKGTAPQGLREVAEKENFLVLSDRKTTWAHLYFVQTAAEIKAWKNDILTQHQGLIYTGNRTDLLLRHEDVIAGVVSLKLTKNHPQLIYINMKLLIVE